MARNPLSHITRKAPDMGLNRYRVEAGGKKIADFITDSADFAEARIGDLEDAHPGLTVTQTSEDA